MWKRDHRGGMEQGKLQGSRLFMVKSRGERRVTHWMVGVGLGPKWSYPGCSMKIKPLGWMWVEERFKGDYYILIRATGRMDLEPSEPGKMV